MPPILVMCFYSRVNEGSGTVPFRGCVRVCDTTEHMVLVDLSLGWFVALVQQAAGAAVSMPASRIMGLVDMQQILIVLFVTFSVLFV